MSRFQDTRDALLAVGLTAAANNAETVKAYAAWGRCKGKPAAALADALLEKWNGNPAPFDEFSALPDVWPVNS